MFRKSDITSHIFLPELIEFERENPDVPRITLNQQLELCITAINEITNLHARGILPQCLGLHGLVVNITGNLVTMRIGSITLPTIEFISRSQYTFDDLFITTTDSNLSEQSSVQLLGLLFFKIFQSVLFSEHLKYYISLDATSHQRLIDVLKQMTHPDPKQRPTLNAALDELRFIQTSYNPTVYGPSRKLINDIQDQQMRRSNCRKLNMDTRQLTLDDEANIKKIAEAEQSENSHPAAALAAAAASACMPRAHLFFKMNNSDSKLSNASDDLESLPSLPTIYDDDPRMDIYQNF